MFTRQQNEGRQRRQKVKTETRGRERLCSILHVNNGTHLEMILNTLHEIPVMPTAFEAGGECKILHLLPCGLATDGNSQPMTKTKG